jgi:putative ABC transport system substrate-binding protein
MNKREFITVLGGAAAAWPLTARAQQRIGKVRHLGVLLPGPHESSMGTATRDRLRELGYNEGRDIIFDTRWAEGMPDRLDAMAAKIVRLNTSAIVA